MAVIPIKHLPLGFRFHPTDAELINHYLKRKINGRIRSDPVAVIPEIDVCKSEPWDLPDKALIQSSDGEWFFFAPRDRKYVNSARHNRATESGYWKATGKDRVIRGRGVEGKGAVEIGRKKTLVFHRGRAPKGERTGWIMHEYRTVEPEFETGEEGQFVLCRLFKKLEENNSSSKADELESGGFSPAPTKSSASDTQHGPDTCEEFGTRPPESNLQQISAHSQPLGTQRCVCNEADCSTTYPSKPEESHRTSSTVSDLADRSGPEDVLPQFIGEHCSNGGPSFSSPLVAIDEDLLFHDYSSTEWLQDADANANPDANADLEYLESLLNDEEDDFSDLFDIQNDFVDEVEPVYQVCPTMFPPLDLKPCKDSGTSSMVDVEPVFTQEHSQAYGSGMIHPLVFESDVELNTSHSYPERGAQINLIWEASPREINLISSNPLTSTRSRPELFYDSGAECFRSLSRNMEDPNTLVGHSSTGINIKYRQPRLRSRNTVEDQGSAARRLRLQICDSKTDLVVKAAPKEEEGEYSEHQIAEEREISCPILDELEGVSDNGNKPERFYDTGAECIQSFSRSTEDPTTLVGHSSTGINIKYRQPCLRSRNTAVDQGSAVRRLRLQICDSKTDIVVKAAPKEEEGEYSEHQIAEEREISCPIPDELECLSDNDDSTYLETKPKLEPAQESKLSVRLRKKLTNDLGNEPEGKTSHRRTHGSVSVNKVIVLLFVFLLLLCVGTWYHIYS